MAKIARIEMYIYDANADEELDSLEEEVLYQIDERTDMNILAIHSEEKGFEWSDDVVINKIGCGVEDIEEFFEGLPEGERWDV